MACDNILDVPPKGKLIFEQFWQSEDHAVASIAGLYSNLGASSGMNATSISPIESYIYWGELRGEILSSNAGKYPSDQIEKENVDNLNVAPGDVTTKFTQFYKIINGANQAIKYIPGIKEKDPGFTSDQELMGEAYFIRGFAYFWLVRTFKEAPIVLDASETDGQSYNVPKSSMEALFDRIEEDLTKAKSMLPNWYENEVYSRCRATKYTAMTALADLYLWRAALTQDVNRKNGYYDLAIENCDGVINSKKYVMVPGVSFGNIFAMGTTSEAIFETYANSLLNNQVNNLRSWFTDVGYWLVPVSNDELFEYTMLPDYRSASNLPPGPVPEKGTAVSFSVSSRYVAKYSKSTRDARWIYYRYPEILLMKAEALAHRYVDDDDKLKEASELINQIRARATGVTTYTKVEAATTQEMDEVILDERAREFIGEGRRWFELVRFASRDNFAHPDLLTTRILNAFSGVQQLVMLPRVINPDAWYLPLNDSELAANPNLIQNPYYN
jgi:hypothetical protein